jgi:hypothetical protein
MIEAGQASGRSSSSSSSSFLPGPSPWLYWLRCSIHAICKRNGGGGREREDAGSRAGMPWTQIFGKNTFSVSARRTLGRFAWEAITVAVRASQARCSHCTCVRQPTTRQPKPLHLTHWFKGSPLKRICCVLICFLTPKSQSLSNHRKPQRHTPILQHIALKPQAPLWPCLTFSFKHDEPRPYEGAGGQPAGEVGGAGNALVENAVQPPWTFTESNYYSSTCKPQRSIQRTLFPLFAANNLSSFRPWYPLLHSLQVHTSPIALNHVHCILSRIVSHACQWQQHIPVVAAAAHTSRSHPAPNRIFGHFCSP